MKIKKFKFKQILKLHLLNSRAYEYAAKKTSPGLLTDLTLTQVISDFKKGLHIIFQYHQAEKRILFIGVPKKLEGRINKTTNHLAVPSTFNLQGVISNNLPALKAANLNKHSLFRAHSKLLLPKLLKKPDLVVLFSHEKKQSIITESQVAKVPLITFGSGGFSSGSQASNLYKLEGLQNGLNETSNENLFSFGLNFLFRRPRKKLVQSNFQASRKKRF